MRRILIEVLVTITLALPMLASAGAAPAAADPNASAVAATEVLLRQGFDALQHNDIAAAQPALDQAVQSPGFPGVSPDIRYQALLATSMIANQNNQEQKALALATRATAFAFADNTAWSTRLDAAYRSNHFRDAGRSLTVLAQRWPDKLDQVNDAAIWQLHQHLQRAHDTNADREMLDALFDAKWQDHGTEPSSMWRDLTLLLIDRKEAGRAAAVAKRITSAQVALSMRVDKRFDSVTGADPQAFDVDHVMAAEIAAAQMRVKAHPDQLEPLTNLQELYLLTRQFQRVLDASDAVVARAKRNEGANTYTDFADKYDWILDNRSRALQGLGRWQEAVRTEILAARRPENGNMNVSERINLADLYAELQQPGKATDAIIELGPMSPYGQMQLESVKLMIAIDQDDSAGVSAAMKYMQAHRGDAIGTWESALLLTNRLDDAANLLIERLHKPDWRNDALVDMQGYVHGDETPAGKLLRERMATIVARADVQAAMQKVGRIEQFDITAQLL